METKQAPEMKSNESKKEGIIQTVAGRKGKKEINQA